MANKDEYTSALRDQRVVKLLLPLPLVRQMDRVLLDGVGGFTTRNELVREALESYMLDLSHEPAPAEPTPIRTRKTRLEPVTTALDVHTALSKPVAERVPVSVADTALPVVSRDGSTVEGESRPEAEPLFGLHNRDYPSLWAAGRLAAYVDEGSISFAEFADRVTSEAWQFAASLGELEEQMGRKLTALFPTNAAKPDAASAGFRSFAIGSVSGNGSGLRSSGPLFLWRVADAERDGETIRIGLRREGRELLSSLSGLTVEPPHPPHAARLFLSHLRHYAGPDHWGFEHVLKTVAKRPTRIELVEAFQAARSDWRESVAATNAQGYVARGREWGLIAPKVVDGRYELTDFGVEILEGVKE
jgi:hypothetical protein